MYFFSILTIFLIPAGSYAEDCPATIRSVRDVLTCADTKAPEVQQARLELVEARLQVQARGQWRNPDVSVTSFSGRVAGSRQSETDFMLGIPVELGGKIAARKALGQAGVEQAQASLFASRAKVKAITMLNLHRLRQIKHELSIVDESIETFDKLNRQYGGRPRLSPEQQASASVYLFAKSQYDLRKSDLTDELAQLNAYFQVNVGVPEPQLNAALPPSPHAWPAVETESKTPDSPALRAALAGASVARANLDLARSEAWPTLSVGPSFRLQNQGGVSGNLLGFNIGLPLPVFNANGAGRAAAAAGVVASEAARDVQYLVATRELEQLTRVYVESVRLLRSTMRHEEIEKNHRAVEGLFTRGVVPSALVIEAHRSYLDLEVARNARERKAIETLFGIYTLKGTVLEEAL